LDVGRVKALLNGRKAINIHLSDDISARSKLVNVWLEYFPNERKLHFRVRHYSESLPNLDVFNLPGDVSKLNHVMRKLNVFTLECSSDACRAAVQQAVDGLPGEVGLGPSLLVS